MGLLENLYLMRSTDAGRLTLRQRARLRRSRQLQAALEENALLAAPQFPPAPDRGAMLGGAYSRRTDLPALRAAASAQPLRRGWAAGGLLLLAGATLALLLVQQRPSWAQMDGYVLSYPLVYPGYAACVTNMSTPGPVQELHERVAAWAKAHADAAPPGWKFGLAYDEGIFSVPEDPWVKQHQRSPLVYAAVVKVTLLSDDEQLLASLLQATSGIPHVSTPGVDSQSWYYHQRLSKLFSRQDTLLINGRRYSFPRDFEPRDAELLGEHCASLQQGWPMAYAFFDPQFEQRFDLGTICRMERLKSGTVKISKLTDEPVFAGLDLPRPYILGLGLRVADNNHREESIEDIRRALYDLAKRRAANKQEEFKEFAGWGIIIPLLPAERFEGALEGRLPAQLSPAEQALTEQRYQQLQAAFDAWAKAHQAQLQATRLRGVVSASPGAIYRQRPGTNPKRLQDYDRDCLSFVVEMYLQEPALRHSLLEALRAGGLVHEPLVQELYPHQVPVKELQGPGSAISSNW